MKLNEDQAKEIYVVLIEECGACAQKNEVDNFVRLQAAMVWREYRFQGLLGFGGKFRNDNGRLYVDCYKEDETPLRRKFIDEANERLAELARKFRSRP